jgi:hypothetical protein
LLSSANSSTNARPARMPWVLAISGNFLYAWASELMKGKDYAC